MLDLWKAAAVTAAALLVLAAGERAWADEMGSAESLARGEPAWEGEVASDESRRIDAWVEERMTANGIPGAAVAVVRSGQVVHWPATGSPTRPVAR